MIGFRLVIAAVALALGVVSASAQSVVKTDNVEARLIAEVQSVAPGEIVTLALRQKIREHWHTYWKNPGDSGEPTAIEWTLPAGFEAGGIVWPAPERLPVGPLLNFGYSGTVLLLTEMRVPSDAKPGTVATIKADATWLVCEKICIPEEGTLTLDLPVRAASSARSEWADEIAATREALPRTSPWKSTYASDSDSMMLFVAAPEMARSGVKEAAFFPDTGETIKHAAKQEHGVGPQGLVLRTKVDRLLDPRKSAPPETLTGVLVLTQDDGARSALVISAERGAIPDAAAAAIGQGGASDIAGVDLGGEQLTLPGAILFAFLGGLILNLMPCVFPILSMKGLALLSKAGKGNSSARVQGLAYTIGVVASFMLVAFILIMLRNAGEEIGWGFQFQSPIIVSLVAILFFVVGLNLSGVFEIAGSFQGAGNKLANLEGPVGSFFTGVLAVVVATPCTAPFMAGATGFAMLQSTGVALAVFAALGLGMALPFLAVSFSPALLRALPRPGPWMVRLKEFLAFPMYASAVWLIWVLHQQTSSLGVAATLGAMVAIAFAAWAWGTAQRTGAVWGRIAAAAGVAGMAALLVFSPISEGGAPENAGGEETVIPHEPFTPERLAQLRDMRKPVFVNLTAAWCITCLLNEQMALSSERMAETFRTRGIVYLKGDWTNRDPVIARVLKEYGRSGVPLYLYFAPGAEARVLPQILTEGELIDALHVIDTAQVQDN